MPGSYTLTYSVTNSNGATDSVDRQLIVYQAASYSASLVLFKDTANATEAEALAAGLTNSSSEQYAAGAAAVLAALPSDLAAKMQPTDVVVNSAAVVQQPSLSFSVTADISIYLFAPSGVHKKEVDGFKAAVANSASSSSVQLRRLLLHDESARRTKSDGSRSSAASTVYAGTPVGSAVDNVARFLRMLQEHSSSSSSSASGNAGCLSLTVDVADEEAACRPAGAAARRKLLQTSSGIDSRLAALNSSLTANMGASGTRSEAITDQNVDLLAVSIRFKMYRLMSQTTSALSCTMGCALRCKCRVCD
jgi:hypothetical protein